MDRSQASVKDLQISVELLNKHLDTENAETITRQLKADNGNFSKTLSVLQGNNVDDNALRKTRLIQCIAPLANDYPAIVHGLLQRNGQAEDLRDIALSNSLQDLADIVPSSPSQSSVTARKQAPKRALFAQADGVQHAENLQEALAFRQALFKFEPTAVLQRMAKDDELGPFEDEDVRTGTVKFFENQPRSFDIRKTSVLRAFNTPRAFKGVPVDKQEAVSRAVKQIQRVQSLTSHPEHISPLISAGLSSAFQISSIPEKSFLDSMKSELHSDDARSIHEHATATRIRNDEALTTLLQTVRGTGITALDGDSSMEHRKGMLTSKLNASLLRDESQQDAPPIVDLEALFGSLDYCECSDCNSINSPAAYFVELLQFLRNNNLHWDTTKWPNSGLDGVAGTALEFLLSRRPDLANLELTCENTNTILPYIDLANEVMESFVVHRFDYINHPGPVKRAKIDVFNIDDESSSELLSEPQNTNYKAYCILKNAVFPTVATPYHQALDEARIFLEYLKTSRYEVLTTFVAPFKSHSNSSATADDALRRQYHITKNRIATSEFWLMTQTEYIAITKESYWSKQFWELKKKTKITDEDYQKHICRNPTWEYWGYACESEMQNQDEDLRLGLKFVKKQFLPRAYIRYTDLVDLVRTRYMNPNYPTGRDRVILNSLRFSYQALMTLVKRSATDPWQRFGRLIHFLLQWQPWAQEHGVEDVSSELCLSKMEVYCWVKTWFEAIGKIVVLESGERPQLPIEGHVVVRRLPDLPDGPDRPRLRALIAADPEGATWEKIGYLSRDGLIRDEEKLIGSVAEDSTVLNNENEPIMEGREREYILVMNPSLENFDDPQDINANQILAVVEPQTSKLAWMQQSVVLRRIPELVKYSPVTESCNIDNVRIQHLDGTCLELQEWDRAQAFLRLWRRLGWTINEVDQALAGLVGEPFQPGSGDSDEDTESDSISDWGQVIEKTCCDCSCSKSNCKCGKEIPDKDDCCTSTGPGLPLQISPDALEQLVAVRQLSDMTGIELMQLLSLWTTISVEGNPSLYGKLFLVHSIYAIDDVFKANDDGDFLTEETKVSNHLPVLLASLKLNTDALTVVMAAAGVGLEDNLTLENVSKLYAYTVMGRVFGVKPQIVPQIADLCGNPFTNAKETLRILKLWYQIQDSGFTLPQMAYMIQNVNNPLRPLGPTNATILKATKTIFDGLHDIGVQHADVTMTDIAKVTSDFVSGRVSLLFDSETSSSILGLLQGTTPYTTNAPSGLVLQIPDALAAKISYTDDPTSNPPRATLSVIGILTESETTMAKALANSQGWADAISRINKRPGRLFDNTLYGIFTNEQAAKAALLAGDVPPPPPPVSPADPPPVDNSTARPKMLFFLQGFMPFLRRSLAETFIVDTVTAIAQISSPELARLLLTKVIFVEDGAKNGLRALSHIHEIPGASEGFNGFLIPNATDQYTFVAGGFDSEPPPLIVDSQVFRLSHRQEDPNNVWYSDPVQLTNGKLHNFSVTGQPVSNLEWKTARSPTSKIPISALLPKFSSAATSEVFVKMYKAGLLLGNFNISINELQFFLANAADFDNINFNQVSFAAWKRLADYIVLRNSLPPLPVVLIDFFKWAKAGNEAGKLADHIFEVTNWPLDVIKKLITHLQFNDLTMYVNEMHLLALQKAVTVQAKVGVDVDLLFRWAEPLSFFWDEAREIAQNIRNTVRARYDVDTWERIAQPLFDKLRGNQRDALIAFLLVQEPLKQWGVTNADSLFEFFLIDVQMGACLQTSRIKQAISTVQLFVQRCLLGLEKDRGVDPVWIDADRWKWMNGYRLWEANRKVFLYPENWLEPTLRDDKSEIFKTLESKLLQKDVNPQAVQDAIKNYLFSVDQVSNLQVIGLLVEEDEEVDLIHVFGKTRNAPSAYFYRYFNTATKNWLPWETMQVEILTYEEENSEGKITESGSYLLPVTWNRRLLAFLPQFAKKSIPIEASKGDKEIIDVINDKVKDSVPLTYWEIKMGWTEYRNGKWMQKKVTSGSVAKIPPVNATNPPSLPPISGYQFVPKIIGISPDTQVFIGVFHNSTDAIGWFRFDGSQVLAFDPSSEDKFSLGGAIPTTFLYKTDESTKKIHSFQDTESGSGPLDLYSSAPYVSFDTSEPMNPIISLPNDDPKPQKIYNSYSHRLLARASTSPTVKGVYDKLLSLSDNIEKADAFGSTDNPPTTSSDYHELKTPSAIYQWELGMHAPALLMNKLLSVQLFDQALEVAHLVFNPFAKRSSPPKPGDLWQFQPFKNVLPENVLEKTFEMLNPNTRISADHVINEWRDNPFAPHVVARHRRVAYMKWFAVQYIKILIAYGDYYFTQNTLESIPYAIQLYVRAAHLYGPKGQKIPRRGKKKAETFNSLLNLWDGFSNAVVQMELMFPFSNQSRKGYFTLHDKNVLANVYGFATSRYFCIPNNPELEAVRDLIDDRLYKIRHCQDINGVVRQLPLFEPPLDVGLLVQAAASGISFASVISDLNSPMANYRFMYLIQKSIELCAELKSMASAFLGNKEKLDGETIAHMRAAQESTMGGLVLELKKQALEDAKKTLAALEYSRNAPIYRLKHYLRLIGADLKSIPEQDKDFQELENRLEPLSQLAGFKLVNFETHEMDKANQATEENSFIGELEALAGFLHALPSTDVCSQPGGVGGKLKWSAANFAHGTSAGARAWKNRTDGLSAEAGNSGRMTSFLRQLQERVLAANNAGYEISNIDKQLQTQLQKVTMAEQEVTNQQQAMDNSKEVEEFLKNKYTNEALYSWMQDNIRTLHYQTYMLAYQLAKKAERAYVFERGLNPSDASFISFGYWDANRDGLLAGERLYLGLKQLENAYQSDRGHDYEITKHVSVRQLAPLALVQLRELGICEFTLPEVLLDMDFPGHYQRRIKSVAVSIPCVVGPYTSISCTLRLLDSEYRVSAIAGSASDYPRSADADDPRFRKSPTIPVSAIAASTANNDSGVFELNFKDERYMPFEGAGAGPSKWRIELPTDFRAWDYTTITDVILHVRYTSKEGGEKLKLAAAGAVRAFVKNVEAQSNDLGLYAVFDLRSEFAAEWARAAAPPAAAAPDKTKRMALRSLADRLPVYTRSQSGDSGGSRGGVTAADVFVLLSKGSWVSSVSVVDPNGDATPLSAGEEVGDTARWVGRDIGVKVGDWGLEFGGGAGERLKKGWVVVRYVIG